MTAQKRITYFDIAKGLLIVQTMNSFKILFVALLYI